MSNIDIDQLERSLVEQLKPLEEEFNIKVIAFPDAENIRPATQAFTLVGWVTEDLAPPNGRSLKTRSMIQDRTLRFEVAIHLKNLRSHAGAYAVIERIRELIAGHRLEEYPSAAFYTTAGRFVERDHGFWTYQVFAEIQIPYVISR